MQSYPQAERIEVFREKHLDEVAHLVTNSFLQMNYIWNQNKKYSNELFSIVRSKCLPCCNTTHSFVLIYQGKVIGASIQLDYVDYVALPPIQHNNQLMNILGKYAYELDSKIPLREGKKVERGQIMYGLYGVIDPKYANKGFSLKFWAIQFQLGKAFGWECYYTRLSSEISFKMLTYMGAQKVHEVQVLQTPGSKIYLGRLQIKGILGFDQLIDMLKMFKAQQEMKKKAFNKAKL